MGKINKQNLRPFDTEIARRAQKTATEHKRQKKTIAETLQKVMNCLVTDKDLLKTARENGFIGKVNAHLTYKEAMSLVQVLQACGGDTKAFDNVCKYCGEITKDEPVTVSVDSDNADGVKDLIDKLTVKQVDGVESELTEAEDGENND